MLAQLPPALQKLQLPLRLRLWDGHEFNFGPTPSVTIVVKDPTLVAQFTHPSLDLLGSAFVEGRLELEGSISEAIRVCDELSQALLDDEDDTPPPRVHHDKATDAESISYHYDLSNDFYQLWLDRDMAYSCGYFETGEESLDEAQQAKFRLLCRKLRLKPGEYLLDVGCGWGGLARFAAREYGVKVFGITLSKEQLTLARERVNAEGLQDKVDLQLLDYRDLPQDGRFDKIVSVGMFEHVGHANLREYCEILSKAVREGGLVMNHGITSKHTDGRQVGRGAGDFIDRYVFPNGELPHLSMMTAEISEAGLEVVDVESLRLHYARTLEHWSQRLEQNLEAAAKQVPEQALRIWRLYLAGCAYAFAHGWINIDQILATKPHADGSLELPPTRADIYR
ncbi:MULTISPECIES: C17 cyclopropane fatty acid synthase CfaB [Pseudomonas]|jgi:cyclopropane-fatty-acyl-phospholipid synthase|uniref:Class I SAM-dependent methyltransferase n=1 Tax=Pseudomonas psychrophila TaxID=122355 RepID=A0A8I1FLT5_9PSED|nr:MULTISPECIES: C17 cyclopropane fatty acid synthase CfaB [Pseudomonas]EPJ93009.1 cyclopropane-fatty-acyl-phospholipid synthase [Pseudomonas psychrophila]KAB0484119.1 methyltransferase domain-containing protein [Pseudomonas psychrophila]KMM97072.1 fatty acid methyltransferase [Pseudomonas psychrophila]KOX65210.1 fatty acid methyltransferase [Pseudomonas psychrophila]MBJ2256731.1 class I SAM-dependent methyltransferase [Pseudomonas psychrophila]